MTKDYEKIMEQATEPKVNEERNEKNLLENKTRTQKIKNINNIFKDVRKRIKTII